ncbi:DUF6070 family protein [Oscillospiraceae bacterium PP1C4]
MHKKSSALIALLLCFSLVGCGETPVSTASEVALSAAGSGPSEQRKQEPSSPEPNALFAQMMQAVAPTAEKIKETLGEDEHLTLEQEKELLNAAKPLDAPVTVAWSLRGLGMENYQALKDFCQSVKREEDAQTAYYEIEMDGVSEHRFTAKEGKLNLSSCYWSFSDAVPDPGIYGSEEADYIEFWDNGWMIWYSDAPKGHTVYRSGVRVVPLQKELIGLYENYVYGLDWANDNVLHGNWDAQNHSVIRWEFLFGALLWRDGKELTIYEPVEMSCMDEGPYIIPAADVEELLMCNFPVTVEELHALPNYRADTQTYEFGYFQGSGSFKTGEVEVADRTDNPDGSFTLRLDWVDPEFAAELRGRYYLTIMTDDNGGYQYISNKVDETIIDPVA